MDLLEVLEETIVPGDGAMGTMIIDAGVPMDRCFEELCVSEPDLIRGIHQKYLDAGALVIETNSFGGECGSACEAWVRAPGKRDQLDGGETGPRDGARQGCVGGRQRRTAGAHGGTG